MSYARLAPEVDSRLGQLIEQHAQLKATADAAAEQLKAVTDAIKLAATEQCPEATTIELAGHCTTLKVAARTSWRLDTKAMKETAPEVYVQFAKQVTTWVLSKVSQ